MRQRDRERKQKAARDDCVQRELDTNRLEAQAKKISNLKGRLDAALQREQELQAQVEELQGRAEDVEGRRASLALDVTIEVCGASARLVRRSVALALPLLWLEKLRIVYASSRRYCGVATPALPRHHPRSHARPPPSHPCSSARCRATRSAWP